MGRAVLSPRNMYFIALDLRTRHSFLIEKVVPLNQDTWTSLKLLKNTMGLKQVLLFRAGLHLPEAFPFTPMCCIQHEAPTQHMCVGYHGPDGKGV